MRARLAATADVSAMKFALHAIRKNVAMIRKTAAAVKSANT